MFLKEADSSEGHLLHEVDYLLQTTQRQLARVQLCIRTQLFYGVAMAALHTCASHKGGSGKPTYEVEVSEDGEGSRERGAGHLKFGGHVQCGQMRQPQHG